MIDRAALGRRGERAAARYLKRRRYRILAKNFSCSLGELDLICADGAEVVFVEVKTRTTGAMFDVTDAVRTCQVDRIARTARWFLAAHCTAPCACRFDVVTVWWRRCRRPVVQHFENALDIRAGATAAGSALAR